MLDEHSRMLHWVGTPQNDRILLRLSHCTPSIITKNIVFVPVTHDVFIIYALKTNRDSDII